MEVYAIVIYKTTKYDIILKAFDLIFLCIGVFMESLLVLSPLIALGVVVELSFGCKCTRASYRFILQLFKKGES